MARCRFEAGAPPTGCNRSVPCSLGISIWRCPRKDKIIVTEGTYLLHLHALDQDVVLVVLVVVVEKPAVQHDWVVFLGDLVGLREITESIVLAIELDLRKNATTEGERSFDRLVEAVLVQHWQHAREGKINEVGMSIWCSVGFTERCREHFIF